MTDRDAHLPDWVQGLPMPLDDKLGLTIHELTPQRAVASCPVEGNQQPFGLWHGGASCVLVESLGSMASAAHGLPEKVAVGVDINVTHHKAVRSGTVTGTATALHLGRRTTCHEVVLTDDDGQRIATGRITCQLVPATAPGA